MYVIHNFIMAAPIVQVEVKNGIYFVVAELTDNAIKPFPFSRLASA